MDECWRVLARIRDLRARLAQQEVLRQRQIQARARAVLQEAQHSQERYEQQSSQARALLAARVDPGSDTTVSAAEAQQLLSHVLGTRLRAQEAKTPIRRAELQCQRAREAVDEAGAQHRREVERREAVQSQWRSRVKVARRRAIEREDQTVSDEWVGSNRVLRLTSSDGHDADD
jgi:hypothetical protein